MESSSSPKAQRYSVSYELTHECFSSFLINRNFRFKLFNLFSDWGPQIDVVGFCFLDLASNYEPPAELVEWLEAGDKPIYIGFGSLVSFFFLHLNSIF